MKKMKGMMKRFTFFPIFNCRTIVAVELLEPSFCMRPSGNLPQSQLQPERLMALKIRLAEKLGYSVIQVPYPRNIYREYGQEEIGRQQLGLIKHRLDSFIKKSSVVN